MSCDYPPNPNITYLSYHTFEVVNGMVTQSSAAPPVLVMGANVPGAVAAEEAIVSVAPTPGALFVVL